jgi:hypothetical protein
MSRMPLTSRRLLALAGLAIGCAVAVGADASSGAARDTAGPPAGLSPSGRITWNLEALLRDTFGNREVNLQLREFGRPEDFSLAFRGDCCSGSYVFVFSNPHGSQFRARRVSKPPKPVVGASGADVPLTIRGAYVYCGKGQWLYLHEGEGTANWQLSCNAPG